MISASELSRRLIMFMEALWEAREEVVDRIEHAMDRKDLDWFERERFDDEMDRDHRIRRRREKLNLQAAYGSEAVHVTCTNDERSEALRLAFSVLEGKIAPEDGVDRLLGDGFPHGKAGTTGVDGPTR